MARSRPPDHWVAIVRQLGPGFAARAAAHDAADAFVADNYAELRAHRVFAAGVPAGRGPATSWLVASREDVDVCLKDPGFGVDLVVTADLGAFTRVWLGDVSFDQALRSRGVRVEGPRELVRAFPGWLLLSHFAGVARPARAS